MRPIRRQVQYLWRCFPRAPRAIWGIPLALGLTLGAARSAQAQGGGAAPGGASNSQTVAAMKADLRQLVSANEVYHAKNGRYSNTVGTLVCYRATAGVTVTILSATAAGWAAQATAASMPGKSCVISVGSVATPPTTQGEKRSAAEAVAVCDQP
jgi:hypothetical protein